MARDKRIMDENKKSKQAREKMTRTKNAGERKQERNQKAEHAWQELDLKAGHARKKFDLKAEQAKQSFSKGAGEYKSDEAAKCLESNIFRSENFIASSDNSGGSAISVFLPARLAERVQRY